MQHRRHCRDGYTTGEDQGVMGGNRRAGRELEVSCHHLQSGENLNCNGPSDVNLVLSSTKYLEQKLEAELGDEMGTDVQSLKHQNETKSRHRTSPSFRHTLTRQCLPIWLPRTNSRWSRCTQCDLSLPLLGRICYTHADMQTSIYMLWIY